MAVHSVFPLCKEVYVYIFLKIFSIKNLKESLI